MYFIYWKILWFFSYVWNMSKNYSWNQKKYQRVGPQSVNIQEIGTMVPWEWEASNDYSLSQVIASITFWWLLIKINIPVNEVQCKSIKGEKKSRFLHWNNICSYREKFSAMKTNNVRRFKLGNVYIFCLFGVLQNFAHIFNVIIWGKCTFLSFAMQNPHWLSIFCCVLKLEAVERAFQNR